MKRLLKIKMVGESWSSGTGMRRSGFSHAFVEGEQNPRYYNEAFSPNDIVADLKNKGVDTSAYEKGLDHWVKTGKGFDVLSGKNCS